MFVVEFFILYRRKGAEAKPIYVEGRGMVRKERQRGGKGRKLERGRICRRDVVLVFK